MSLFTQGSENHPHGPSLESLHNPIFGAERNYLSGSDYGRVQPVRALLLHTIFILSRSILSFMSTMIGFSFPYSYFILIR